jgi:hypothetical protein
MGQRQTGYYYRSTPIQVLLLRANDLSFGAVPTCSHRTPGRPVVGVFP